MKKILSLWILYLLGVMPMVAGIYYQPAGQSANRDYPSQEFKTNTQFLLGNPRGDSYDAWTNNGHTYLSPAGMSAVATESSIYVFVATGVEDKHGTPTYFIKNVQSGEFIAAEKDMKKYTKSVSRAQAFTVMEADVHHSQENESGQWTYDWTSVKYDVRTATLTMDTNHHYPLDPCFVEGQEKCYVICLADSETENADGTHSALFLNSCGTGNVRNWQDSNCWALFTPEVVKGEKALQYTFMDLMDGKEFDPGQYPIGTGPGLYPEDKLTAAVEAWEVFYKYLNYGQGSDEDYENAINNLENALKELNASIGALIDGQYYRFWAARNDGAVSSGYDFLGCMYDAGTNLRWTPRYPKPETIDLEASKYVFQLIVKDGKNYFQNYYTKRYMGDVNNKNDALPTTVDPVTNWRIEPANDLIPGAFRLRGNQSNENELWSANTNPKSPYNVGYWQSKTDKGSLWKVETIDPEELRALDEQIAKEKLERDMKDLLLKAQDTYDKGFVYDQYLTDISQVKFNATEATEGTEAALCDGDPSNYYHSRYSEDGNLGQPHWFQVTVEEPLQEFALDVYRRQLTGNANGRIIRWFIAGTDNVALAEKDDYVSEDMNATLEQYKKTWDAWTIVNGKYNQSVMYKGTKYNDAMASFDVSLQKPCKYIRCMALLRYSDKILYDTISVEPLELQEIGIEYNSTNIPKNNIYMHMGEVVMRSKEFNPDLSLINGVPVEIREALVDAIAKAKEETDAHAVTEETYAALEKAYDEFLTNFPDPESLRKDLADAKKLAESAPVGNEPGYFPEDAVENLSRVISQVESAIKDVMSASDVNAGKEELSNAIDALQEKVILPAEGVYFLHNIQTTAEGVENDRYVASFRTGENTLRWGDNILYACEDSPCYYWKLTKNDDNTFSFYNYGTGNYLYGQVEKRGADVAAGPQKTNLKLRLARVGQEFIPGSFDIMLDDTYCLNLEASGRMVSWTPDANCTIEFIEPTDDWSGDYSIVYEGLVPQIITLPYDLKNDCISPLMKLIGTYDGAFQFEEYADDEVIPAGTPVLYYSEDVDFNTDAFSLTTNDLEELTYTTEAKNQNGMVGALSAIKELPVGCGLFFNNAIIGSVEGEGVEANTGYFLTDVATDHKGTFSIPYDSSVKSLEEGIRDAVVINNKAGRGTFNLMGQKVQGKLPAGLYIVNGKKYIVR